MLPRPLRRALFNRHDRLRNGWWMLVFVALMALTRFAFTPLNQALKTLDVSKTWRELLPVLFVLLVTWACLRLRRESLATAGLRLDRRWWRELGWGIGFGIAQMSLVAAAISGFGGVHFELDPARSLAALGNGLVLMLCVATFEELLFRGFLFQRLVDGSGAIFAQVSMAALFAFGHWGNPGMDGTTQLWATLDLSLGAVLLGLAYLRTRSLALPIGLHFGWNYMQGQVLGFAVSGIDQPGWWQPVFSDQAAWLSGGSFGPESSVFAVLVDLVAIALLWRWRGPTRSEPGAVGQLAAA